MHVLKCDLGSSVGCRARGQRREGFRSQLLAQQVSDPLPRLGAPQYGGFGAARGWEGPGETGRAVVPGMGVWRAEGSNSSSPGSGSLGQLGLFDGQVVLRPGLAHMALQGFNQ